MNTLEWVNLVKEWKPGDLPISGRIALGWESTYDENAKLKILCMAATNGNGVAFLISPENFGDFLICHRDNGWIIGQDLEVLCALENSLNEDFLPRFLQRKLIHLETLYELIHLAEFSDAAENSDLKYLAKLYLNQDISNKMLFEDSTLCPELEGIGRTSLVSALLYTSVAYEIFTILLKEALSFSTEKKLLGYDKFAASVYCFHTIERIRDAKE